LYIDEFSIAITPKTLKEATDDTEDADVKKSSKKKRAEDVVDLDN